MDIPMEASSKKKQIPPENIRLIAKEVSTLPPLIMSRLKVASIENGETTPSQIAVLFNLKDQNGPMRMSDLAKKMSSSLPAMTGIVSRLVEKGMVERGDDPSDRRVVTVRLTSQGELCATELLDEIQELWSSLISNLKIQERKDFLRLIRRIKSIITGEVK